MTVTYTIIITSDPESPGWWNAEVPALPGCVSCGQSYEEALEKVREAMAGYLAVLQEHGDPPKELPMGTFRRILKQAGLTPEEFKTFRRKKRS